MMFWKKLKKNQQTNSIFTKVAKYKTWTVRIVFACLFIEIGFIWGLLPDWDEFTKGPVPKSRLIKKYEYEQTVYKDYQPLRWKLIDIEDMPQHLLRAVVVAEDSRFYQHKGLDQEAIRKAMEYNWEKGKIVYGASTISQQTIKNLFLSSSRNPLRKLHEIILTYLMERNVGKRRILEIYLNIAEFGPGVYGVEAASQHYFNKTAAYLSYSQSIELAATLPSPAKHNPNTRTEQWLQRKNKIRRHLRASM